MIANIHDDGEPSFRSRSPVAALADRRRIADSFDFPEDADAMFRRLDRKISPAAVWVRNIRGIHVMRENPEFHIAAGTLCQIGVHLVPSAVQAGGRFCQIVSGPHRGMRFEFKADDFFQEDGERQA